MPRRLERTAGHLRIREVVARYVTLPHPAQSIIEPENAAAVSFQHFETAEQPQELLMAAYLNSRHACVAVELLYRGSVTAATVGTRDVLRSALVLNAAGFVLGHLHPSGDPTPSADDVAFSRRLLNAAELMNVEFVDHIVLGYFPDGGMRFASLRERGLM